jgi:CRP-like cAMP-binding protein
MEKNSYLRGALEASQLFRGIKWDEMEQMLPCLSAEVREFDKDEFILLMGDETREIGLVLSGAVEVIKEDYWGNRNIMGRMVPGDTFAESYACVPGARLNVSVEASEKAQVLFMDVQKIMRTCESSCAFHGRLTQNLMMLLAAKNLYLNAKVNHMMQRTTREKLLSYLSSESVRQGSPAFDIPFNRQQLADYLSVDRSAMSNELGKMRDEGLLEFDKNHFVLEVER